MLRRGAGQNQEAQIEGDRRSNASIPGLLCGGRGYPAGRSTSRLVTEYATLRQKFTVETGPIVISGQAAQFYSLAAGVQALGEEGYEVIWSKFNPARSRDQICRSPRRDDHLRRSRNPRAKSPTRSARSLSGEKTFRSECWRYGALVESGALERRSIIIGAITEAIRRRGHQLLEVLSRYRSWCRSGVRITSRKPQCCVEAI